MNLDKKCHAILLLTKINKLHDQSRQLREKAYKNDAICRELHSQIAELENNYPEEIASARLRIKEMEEGKWPSQ